MPTQEVIDMIMSGKHNDHVVAEEVDDYPEKLQRAVVSQEVPEWVRRAAHRIIEISMRKNIPLDRVSFEDAGLGIHDNIVEAAIIGCESERFYRNCLQLRRSHKEYEGALNASPLANTGRIKQISFMGGASTQRFLLGLLASSILRIIVS